MMSTPVSTNDERAEVFERHRARLQGIAYRMLGTVEDAEDIVQEAYLRWHQADTAAVRTPEAWLVAVTTRLSIDRLRRASVQRETYIGSWLPEPVASGAPFRPDHRSELASDLSMALLVLLERLAPEERAAFLLREVFECDYAELARVLERSEAACRQLVHRARERVRRDRPRFAVPLDAQERLLDRFLKALAEEDRDGLLGLFDEDVTFTSDGGGKVAAARKVLRGPERIVRFLLGLERKARLYDRRVRHRLEWLNGEPAVVTYVGDDLFCATSFLIDGDRIAAAYRVLNPDKLRHLSSALARGT